MLNAHGAGLYLICKGVSSVLIGRRHQLSIWRENGPVPFEWSYLYSIDGYCCEARVKPILEHEYVKMQEILGGKQRFKLVKYGINIALSNVQCRSWRRSG